MMKKERGIPTQSNHLGALSGVIVSFLLVLIIVITVFCLIATGDDYGINVDEPDYFRAAWLIENWIEALWTGRISAFDEGERIGPLPFKVVLNEQARDENVTATWQRLEQNGTLRLLIDRVNDRCEREWVGWTDDSQFGSVHDAFLDGGGVSRVVPLSRISDGKEVPGEVVRPKVWDFNAEHPPFSKWVFAVCDMFLGPGTSLVRLGRAEAPLPATLPEQMGLLGPLGGIRSGAAVFLVIAQLSMFFLVRRVGGNSAGLFAAAAIPTLPQVFVHAHFVSLDIPVAAMMVAVVASFPRAMSNRWGWIWTGVLFGFALATKLNAFFLPMVLFPWAVWKSGWQSLKPIAGIVFVSIIVFFISWPWLWSNPLSHFWQFVTFHLGHEILPVYYFGEIYTDPPAPWHYCPVMLSITTPLPVLILTFPAIIVIIKRRIENKEGILLLCSFLLPLLPFMVFRVQVYNGLRLFMASPLFLAGLSGIGFSLLCGKIATFLPLNKQRVIGWSMCLLCGVILLSPGIYSLVRLHPYSGTYYNCLVGGEQGALPPPAGLGFEMVIWSEAVGPQVVEWLNQHLEPASSICVDSAAFGSLREQQRIGRLRRDLIFARGGDYWILNTQFAYWSDSRFWKLWDDRDPEYKRLKAFGPAGIPVLNIYKRMTGRFQ